MCSSDLHEMARHLLRPFDRMAGEVAQADIGEDDHGHDGQDHDQDPFVQGHKASFKPIHDASLEVLDATDVVGAELFRVAGIDVFER